jgi:hypothetical protein
MTTSMSRRSYHCVGLIAATCLIAQSLLAQAPDSAAKGAPWLAALSVGVPGYRTEVSPLLFTLGLHFTQLRDGKLSADLAIGTMPILILAGLPVVGVRGGLALPMQTSQRSFLIPSAGLSAIVVTGFEGDGGMVTGWNTGLAYTTAGRTSHYKLGVTWHRFLDGEGTIWLLEVGVPFGDVPRRP